MNFGGALFIGYCRLQPSLGSTSRHRTLYMRLPPVSRLRCFSTSVTTCPSYLNNSLGFVKVDAFLGPIQLFLRMIIRLVEATLLICPFIVLYPIVRYHPRLQSLWFQGIRSVFFGTNMILSFR